MNEEQKPEELLNEGEQDLDEETLFIVSQTFKALSDPTRIRILNFLCSGEHAVNDIAEKLNLSRSEEHTSELQSRGHLVCRLLLEKKKYIQKLRQHKRTSR